MDQQPRKLIAGKRSLELHGRSGEVSVARPSPSPVEAE
jgi:hypothetical protein